MTFATKTQEAEYLRQVESFIGAADAAELTALKAAIDEILPARIAERNAALPEFPVLLDAGGNLVQVTKERAIELLNAGGHTVAPAETKEQ
jgi:hypothetical protein